ncbi:FadR/GntR family transcriptional regulator [Actinomycetes bacterium M1A6_2h]
MTLSDSWARKQPSTVRVGAAEAVLSDLRAAIEGGELAVGERLPSEAALAAKFGVSRSVVREALRSTTTLGLTETHTGKGTFVVAAEVAANPTFGSYTVDALREARPHIEVPAAALAAVRRTADQADALRRLFDTMLAEPDPKTWVRLDAEFHLLIAQASGNDVFAAVIAQIRDALAGQSEMVNVLPDRRQRSDVEHRAIVDAIVDGSADDASEAMRRHLQHVQNALGRLRGDAVTTTSEAE